MQLFSLQRAEISALLTQFVIPTAAKSSSRTAKSYTEVFHCNKNYATKVSQSKGQFWNFL